MTTYEPYDHPSVYSTTSLDNLSTCHLDLNCLMTALASDGWDITVVCGHRPEEQQNEAYEAGNSNCEWDDSEHNTMPSNAVDIAPYIPGIGIPWDDPLPWYLLAGAVRQKAIELGIKVRWGGYFKSIKGGDLGHWELLR